MIIDGAEFAIAVHPTEGGQRSNPALDPQKSQEQFQLDKPRAALEFTRPLP
jgi:hypothetical protein